MQDSRDDKAFTPQGDANQAREIVTDSRPPVGGRSSRAVHRRMGSALAFVALVASALALLVPPASAGVEVLREAYAPPTWDNGFANVWSNQRVAQSFTARTDFLLTHLELFVFDQPQVSGPDILQVSVTTDAGNSPGTALATTAKQGVQNWTWVAFGFYPWVALSAGERYWVSAEDAEPRPKGYEWAMNTVGSYPGGEAQWFDTNTGTWVNGTGADLFFRVYGISGPSIRLETEPSLIAVDPGATVPIDVYFNNSGNDAASAVTIDVDLSPELTYIGDDAAVEGGLQISPMRWTFSDIGMGPHGMTVWAVVEPSLSYYDGKSLNTWVFLNYTDASGQVQAPSWDLATVTVLVPVVRAQAYPTPDHVDPGQTFNFTVSFFNIASGDARYLWMNASAGDRLLILGDDAVTAGGTTVGPNAWLFRDVGAQAYVFNVTVQATGDALPGDRLVLVLDLEYTDGGGHPFAQRRALGHASVHGPSLVVAATMDSPTPRPGDAIRLTLFANNTGDQVAYRAWLNTTLPAGTTLEDSQPVSGTRTGNMIAYTLQDVAPGPVALNLRLRVDSDAAPGAVVDVTASLDVANASGRILRPSAASTNGVVVSPRFSITITSAVRYVEPGEIIDLSLRWNNSGNEAANRAWMNFTLPEKTLLVNSTMPWSFTNGTTFGWQFSDVGPGEQSVGVRLEVSARVVDRELLVARLEFRYERADAVVSATSSASHTFQASLAAVSSFGLDLVVLWIAILAAVFLLFLLLGYMDVLPHKRTLIDDVFLLHNSGILICHYSTTLRPDVDSDIASGMLMAVRNFVADALRSKNGALQELKYGDHRIHMVHGQHAVLVTFTRGGNGKSLEMRMAEVLRNIETAYVGTLENWSGRTEEFKGVEEYLLRLIQT